MRRFLSGLSCLSVAACAASPETVTLFYRDAAPVAGELKRNSCYDLPNGECVEPEQVCGEFTGMQLFLSGDDAMLDEICLPPSDSVESLYFGTSLGLPSLNDNDVLQLSGQTVTDLYVGAYDVLVQGPGTVDGALQLEGVGTVATGLTATGSARLGASETALTDCVIEGGVTLSTDDVQLAGCTVYGTVRVTGVRVRLTQNTFYGEVLLLEDKIICEDNIQQTPGGDWVPYEC